MMIEYLQHEQIDKIKWDNCIRRSVNAMIYAESWYLDIVSPGWNALSFDDYQAVMPLTWKKKWGFVYLAQPPFTQQLGIFSREVLGEKMICQFISSATERFSLTEIQLNHGNLYENANLKTNFILPLSGEFRELRKQFRKDLVTRAKRAALAYEKHDNYHQVILDFEMTFRQKSLRVHNTDLEKLRKLCDYLHPLKRLLVRQVSDPGGNILSSALFFRDPSRIYYMISSQTPTGRKSDATAFLLYSMLKEFSKTSLTFDFEGSSVSSIRFFFEKFNPAHQDYPVIFANRLPGVINFLRKIV